MLSNFAALSIFVLFVMHVAVRGTLPRYIELLFYTPKDAQGGKENSAQGQQNSSAGGSWLGPAYDEGRRIEDYILGNAFTKDPQKSGMFEGGFVTQSPLIQGLRKLFGGMF